MYSVSATCRERWPSWPGVPGTTSTFPAGPTYPKTSDTNTISTISSDGSKCSCGDSSRPASSSVPASPTHRRSGPAGPFPLAVIGGHPATARLTHGWLNWSGFPIDAGFLLMTKNGVPDFMDTFFCLCARAMHGILSLARLIGNILCDSFGKW